LQTFGGEKLKVCGDFPAEYDLRQLRKDWNKVVSYKTGLYVCGVGEYMKYFVVVLCFVLLSCLTAWL